MHRLNVIKPHIMKARLALLFLLLSYSSYIRAQQSIAIHVFDAATKAPLQHVIIADKYGNTVTQSDDNGLADIADTFFTQQKYLLVMQAGYVHDTIYAGNTNVYLQRLSVTLKEATVNGNKVSRLLRLTSEYVVDYDFVKDNVIAAAYSGANGGNAKLFLLNNDGVILASCKIPDEPMQLFKSCIGIYYCVCHDKFYPILIDTNTITLGSPRNITVLPALMQCELTLQGNKYYRMDDRRNFSVTYEMLQRGDTQFKPIERFEEQDVAKASFEEYIQILILLEHYQFAEAARLDMQRRRWDKGSFSHIDMPLFASTDSLVIFDFFKKNIGYYSLSGNKMGSNPIGFTWKQSQQFQIIKDDVDNKFYVHRYDDKSSQMLEEINISTGASKDNDIKIEKPFAEKIKVHNGRLYYLWQDSYTPATRQLFTQRF